MSPSGPGSVAHRRMLVDHVYDALMASLVDGEFEPGSPLRIDQLARDLEVSQTPIREALARLETTGLVRRTALKGYRVAPPPSPEELTELIDARLALEPVNAYRAAERAGIELVGQLRESIEDLAAAPTTGPSFTDFRPYWEADERFHLTIAEAAHNPFLLTAYRSLGGQVQRFRLFAGLGVTDAELAIAEHTAVLHAIENGNRRAARDAMVAHLGNVKRRAVSESVQREPASIWKD